MEMIRERFMRTIGALVALACLSLEQASLRAADEQELKVETTNEAITIGECKLVDSAYFSKYGNGADSIKAEEGMVFLLVDIETEFSAGPGWHMDLFTVANKTKAADTKEKKYSIHAFKVPKGAVHYFLATSGAAGIVLGKEVMIVDNPLGKPNQVYFAFRQDKDGKDVHWPGGNAKVCLMFQVPKGTTSFELTRSSGEEEVSGSPAADPSGDTSAAIATLKRLGATLVEDGQGQVVELTLVSEEPPPANDLRRISELTHLQRITLRWVDLDDDSLAALSGLSELQSVALAGTKITDKGITHIARATELRELALNMTQIGPEGLKQLAALKKLEKLDLGVKVGPFGMAKVSRALSNLVTDEDRKFLSSDTTFDAMLSVRLLETTLFNSMLASKVLTNDALRELAACTSLKVLDLGDQKISDAGITHLRPLVNLEHLTLFGIEKLTDEGLKHLAELKKLGSVVLPYWSGEYTKEGVDQLQRALPTCMIVSKFNVAMLVRTSPLFGAAEAKAPEKVPQSNTSTKYRVWRSKEGKTTEAEFVKFEDGKVSLRKKSGETVYTVPLEMLSEVDQQWVREQASVQPPEQPKQQSTEDVDFPKTKNWPSLTADLSGPIEVRVKNPNNFKVRVALRSAGKGKDFVVPTNDMASVRVPSGRYDVYFQYSSDPDGLYQGDSFELRSNGVEIQIVKIVNGNYGIRKVK